MLEPCWTRHVRSYAGLTTKAPTILFFCVASLISLSGNNAKSLSTMVACVYKAMETCPST